MSDETVHAVGNEAAFETEREVVLGVGGNDAIMNAGILQAKADSTSQVIAALADVSRRFEEAYRRALFCRGVSDQG